jgi:hypothetical protein
MSSLSAAPIELSFPLPKSPDTSIHIHLTLRSTSVLLFLTTATNGDTATPATLGSFVYALPDVSGGCYSYLVSWKKLRLCPQRIHSGQTISTPLYTYESSIEFTTRLAKLLARKLGKPVYVGNSISFASAGMGGTVEEEMEGFKKVVQVVMEEAQKTQQTLG